jgi:hypothetical protein
VTCSVLRSLGHRRVHLVPFASAYRSGPGWRQACTHMRTRTWRLRRQHVASARRMGAARAIAPALDLPGERHYAFDVSNPRDPREIPPAPKGSARSLMLCRRKQVIPWIDRVPFLLRALRSS